MKNKNWFVLILAILLNAQMLYAQQAKDSSTINDLRSFLKLKVSWNFGLEWEKKISKTSSINFFVGPVLGTASDGFSFLNILDKWQFEPEAYAEYRNYYNLGHRNNQHKKTFNNSANFLFVRADTYYPIKHQNFFNLLFVQGWGAQRSLSRKITIDCHLGITEHVYYDRPPNGGFNYILIEPLVNFSFNYVF